MTLTIKRVLLIAIGIVVFYYVRKSKSGQDTIKKISTKGKKIELSKNPEYQEKIDKIKTNVFHLIEKFHYTYKSNEMTQADISNYEDIINNYIVNV